MLWPTRLVLQHCFCQQLVGSCHSIHCKAQIPSRQTQIYKTMQNRESRSGQTIYTYKTKGRKKRSCVPIGLHNPGETVFFLLGVCMLFLTLKQEWSFVIVMCKASGFIFIFQLRFKKCYAALYCKLIFLMLF